ncbi:MAG: zinc ribbon domain-containing protein [Synergistaceae bacterium]|jgi:predicted nucleic acid-binding Zn ribbon protein|nr:zinc ribbon domain-containing protein [Synergistaceae bacterium]
MSENETQTCLKCGAPAKEGDAFCRRCGTKHFGGASGMKPFPEVERVCPNCGNTLRSAARFCDLCGEECVKVRHERRRRKRKKGCFLLFAAILLWLVGVVSAIAIYDASKNMSFKKILTLICEDFSAPDPEVKRTEEEPDGGKAAAVSETPYEKAVSYDRLPLPTATPIAEDETEMSETSSLDLALGALPLNGEEEANDPGNTDDGSSLGESDDMRTSTSFDAETDTSVPAADRQEAAGADVWTEQDSEGYSTVAAADRFFTSSQIPSLRGTITTNRVRVRSAPNTASRIKRQLGRGTEVELIRRFSSGNDRYYWFEARDSAGSGWIYGEFVKPETGGNKVSSVSSGNNPAAESVISTFPGQ